MSNDAGKRNALESDKKSNNEAWLAAAVMAVLVVLGIWYLGPSTSPLPKSGSTTTTTEQPPAMTPQPPPAVSQPAPPARPPAPALAPGTGN